VSSDLSRGGGTSEGSESLRRERKVRDARPDEMHAVCVTLSRAFADDPVTLYLFPGESDRMERLLRFYEAIVPQLASGGRSIVDEDLCGAAIWQRPGVRPDGGLRGLLNLLKMAVALRSSAVRAMRLGQALEAHHPKRPHWYLGMLGTDPAFQGQGIGTATMRPILEICDAEGLPAYLESSKASNIPFYESHGFALCGEIEIPGGLTLWPMMREVSKDAAAT